MKKSRTIAALVIAILAAFSAVTLATPDEPEPIKTPPPRVAFDASKVYQSEAPKIPTLSPDAPCQPLHFGFAGNPKKFETTVLGRYTVPRGRTWRFTSTSILAERHHGGAYSFAGEWTVQIGVRTKQGVDVTVSESSLDEGSGIALQGQGRVDATFTEGDRIQFTTWLRPYTGGPGGQRLLTDRGNYYYTLGASGMDCPEKTSA